MGVAVAKMVWGDGVGETVGPAQAANINVLAKTNELPRRLSEGVIAIPREPPSINAQADCSQTLLDSGLRRKDGN
ncbi:MAG: hypothetical protein C1O27_001228 [Chloroflexi bacterium]|nr:MAG: hypothetical protein C1O27_001228 [Chloroflexota bacterium]